MHERAETIAREKAAHMTENWRRYRPKKFDA
jgi:hypothetical protein